MDRQYIETNDVMARYVKNKLTDDELDAFEEYYFEHPEMLEAVEAERLLRAALKSHDDKTPIVRSRRPHMHYAVAASLVAGLMIGTLLPTPSDTPETGIVQLQNGWVITDRQGSRANVELADLDRPLALTIEVGTQIDEPMRAELLDDHDAVLWSADGVTLDGNGDISILMPAEVLSPQSYSLVLYRGERIVDKYVFEVTVALGTEE